MVRRVVSRWGVVERSLWVSVNHEVLGGRERGRRGWRPVQAGDCGVRLGQVLGDRGGKFGRGF